jgi:Flp pilus assembly protein TadD
MSSQASDTPGQARALFDAGEYAASLRAAQGGLGQTPDDVELLVLAGRAGIEVDAPETLRFLERATHLAPQDASAWHYLGEALATDGQTEAAETAFRRAVELDPDDEIALSNLGHTTLASGRQEEAVEYLARAADISGAGASTAAISLVDMYRSFGEYEKALVQAQKLAAAVSTDPLAWLDVAELSLQVGRLDDAADAFEKLRDLDDVPGHEVYPLHGLIAVEIRRSRWERATTLAAQAAAIESQGLSAELAAFLDVPNAVARAEGPATVDIGAALQASLATYRTILADNRRLAPEAPLD